MAPPDPAPSHHQHSIVFDDDDWGRLKHHAIDERVAAAWIVRELVHQYVHWPAALQAATLRAVRANGDRDEPPEGKGDGPTVD